VDGILVGYARCSTRGQDLRAQRTALRSAGVADDRIYTDAGYTGRNTDYDDDGTLFEKHQLPPGVKMIQRADLCAGGGWPQSSSQRADQ
jgi:resolvase-like protein